MLYLLGLLILGLFVGTIARLVVGNPAQFGCLGPALLGVVGSYVGGTVAVLLFDDPFDLRQASTIIGAILGSIAVLVIWRLSDREGRAGR